MNQLKIGSVLSYLNIFLVNFIMILFTPFMLKTMGQSEYGLYSLIGSFVGYLTVLDFGLGNSIIRYVAKYRAENDKKNESNFIALSLIIYSLISVVVVIFGIVFYKNLNLFFGKSLTIQEFDKARIMFAILIANLAITLPFNTFNSIVTAYEKFVFQRVIMIVRALLRPAVLIVILLFGYKAIAIVLVDTIFNILVLLFNTIFAFKKLKIKVKFYKFDKPLLKEIFFFSFFIFLNLVVDQLYWRTGQVILGIYTSTAMVAIFTVGMQFVNYYMQFSTAISGVFLPRVTQMVVRKASDKEMTDFMIKTGRVQLIVLGFILLAYALFGKEFIILWLGNEYQRAWYIGLLIMIPLTVPLFQNVGISILQARNMHAFRSVSYLFIAIINVGLSVVFTIKFGVIGTSLGTVISLILGNVIVINVYYHLKIGLNMIRFYKEVFSRFIVSFPIVFALGYLFKYLPEGRWLLLFIKGIVFLVLYMFVVWMYGMNEYEKSLFSKPLAKIIMKIRKPKLLA